MIYVSEGRKGFEAIGNMYSPNGTVTRENITIAHVPCAWFIPEGSPENDIVFYIHGGAFIFGSIQSHAPLVSYIAAALKRKVLMVDYRLAPEHPFPAGIDDCIAVIEHVHQQNPQIRFGIIGDSAGGNLTMATQLVLKRMEGPSSQFTILISPWADLECKNESYNRNKTLDTVLSLPYLVEATKMYAPGHDLSEPILSPVHGDFKGLSPVLILCGTYEILEDDARHLHQQLLRCGVQSKLHLFHGELHVWPFINIDTEGSRQALSMMAGFVSGVA